MVRGFEGTTCVLCGTSSSTRQGEHVWPQWYLEDHPPDAGPYPWSKNGKPLPRRDGTPIVEPNLTRVRLPVCRECNGKLDRRFEKPGKPLMRQLLWGPLPSLNAGEVEAVALWLLKTWLLLSRPDVEYANPLIHEAAESFLWPEPAQPQFYEWLVTGTPPPEGLSLWLHRTDDLDGPVEGRRSPAAAAHGARGGPHGPVRGARGEPARADRGHGRAPRVAHPASARGVRTSCPAVAGPAGRLRLRRTPSSAPLRARPVVSGFRSRADARGAGQWTPATSVCREHAALSLLETDLVTITKTSYLIGSRHRTTHARKRPVLIHYPIKVLVCPG